MNDIDLNIGDIQDAKYKKAVTRF